VVSTKKKLVYVISDLHLGGAPDPKNASGRGFRIFTQSDALKDFINGLSDIAKAAEVELVINGDFVDFLAEKGPETDRWDPLKTPESAETILRSIACDRPERIVFEALRNFMSQGGRLTLLLGNHDVELSFPKVRYALEELLGRRSDRPLHFVYDGEAYVIGHVLIEHGNRYDSYNTNDYDALRRVRSLQSRREPIPQKNEAKPSPGSVLVASFINKRKWDFPFIDLLKPENETVIPLLVALDPNVQNDLGTVFRAAAQARKRRMSSPLVPLHDGDIGATEPIADELESIVEQHVGKDGLKEFQEGIRDAAFEGREDLGDIGATRIEKLNRALSIIDLVVNGPYADLKSRMPALYQALMVMRNANPFEPGIEPAGPYLDAITALGAAGFSLVLFGHTHVSRDVTQEGEVHGRQYRVRYLNTGSWVDSIRFPTDLIDGSKETVLEKLESFCQALCNREIFEKALEERTLGAQIDFSPMFARLEFDENDNLLSADLHRFQGLPLQ